MCQLSFTSFNPRRQYIVSSQSPGKVSGEMMLEPVEIFSKFFSC